MRHMLILLGTLVTTTTALAQGRGNAPAQNVNVVNVPEVEVSNVVDVNVANSPSIEISNSLDIAQMAGFSVNGRSPFVIERLIRNPGRIHGLTLSLRSLVGPLVGSCLTRFIVIVRRVTGNVEATVAELQLRTGDEGEVMDHDFYSPIEVRFDPASESATALLFIDGPDDKCSAQVSVIYENF